MARSMRNIIYFLCPDDPLPGGDVPVRQQQQRGGGGGDQAAVVLAAAGGVRNLEARAGVDRAVAGGGAVLLQHPGSGVQHLHTDEDLCWAPVWAECFLNDGLQLVSLLLLHQTMRLVTAWCSVGVGHDSCVQAGAPQLEQQQPGQGDRQVEVGGGAQPRQQTALRPVQLRAPALGLAAHGVAAASAHGARGQVQVSVAAQAHPGLAAEAAPWPRHHGVLAEDDLAPADAPGGDHVPGGGEGEGVAGAGLVPDVEAAVILRAEHHLQTPRTPVLGLARADEAGPPGHLHHCYCDAM